MPCRIIDGPITEHISQRPCHDRTSAHPFLMKTETGKGNPGQIHTKQDHKVIIQVQESRGHEHGKKGERIAHHIIMEGLQDIVPLSKAKVPLRHHQLMLIYDVPENRAQIFRIIYQRPIVLRPAVPLPYQCPSCHEVPGKDHCADHQEQDGVD